MTAAPQVYEVEEGQGDDPIQEAELWHALETTFSSPSYRPPKLPQVAVELLALSGKRNVEVAELVHLLERDSLLATRVVTRSNAPGLGATSPVRSLKAAVVRLGLAELRDLVMEESLGTRVFRAPGYQDALERVRLHSVATAHLARLVATATPFEGDYAFLCGLLHDVGYSTALVALAEGASAGRKPGTPATPLRPVTLLWPALAQVHERVAAHLAPEWKLTDEVRLVIQSHHVLELGGVVHPVAAVVALAEVLASELGFGLVPAATDVPVGLHPFTIDLPGERQRMQALDALRVDARALARLRAEAPARLTAAGLVPAVKAKAG